ncbi:short-chain dehydrogenase [Trichoderma arundinaceum]|uniref:Short-chain dehydrogenase n=1 Tax=Trichoderma arundinaceum TaxID=490622 RepID=A0A395NLE5_TRIAR|nr:short-chain dehydrogenase [Trichoderma arundinaceum]
MGRLETPSPTKIWHTDTYATINPTRPELSVTGKTVVITGGGSGGIGGGIARSFAKAGASRIALLGRREAPLQETKEQIAKISESQVLVVPADMADDASVKNAFETIRNAFGAPNILVCNAVHGNLEGKVQDLDLDSWFAVFQTNIRGTVGVVKAFLGVAAPSPTLVDITSGIATLPPPAFPKFSSYAASKIATTRVFSYLAAELPDEAHVISIHPGLVLTELSADLEGKVVFDTMDLAADFTVWAVSDEARFLKGKVVWSSWDVDELKKNAADIQNSGLFTLGIEGWPFKQMPW